MLGCCRGCRHGHEDWFYSQIASERAMPKSVHPYSIPIEQELSRAFLTTWEHFWRGVLLCVGLARAGGVLIQGERTWNHERHETHESGEGRRERAIDGNGGVVADLCAPIMQTTWPSQTAM